ncbi:MAG: hypothetical protein DCC71_25595 [Proteobacteria bacterium]|nr:MAG: hypothetical protein DCC71_25595 [Pseudomonadota bacterium]
MTDAARTHARFEPVATPGAAAAHAFAPAPLLGDRFVAAPRTGFEPPSPAPTAAAVAPPPPDLDAIRREAYERGVADGRDALPWQDAAALQRALAALDAAGRRLEGMRRGYLVANRHALVELACAIAEHVVGRSLALRRDALASLLGAALAAASEDAAPALVRVAPADLDVLARAPREGEPALRFEADASLAAGEVRVETRTGAVRTSLALALAQVRAGLEEALGAPEPASDAAEDAPS